MISIMRSRARRAITLLISVALLALLGVGLAWLRVVGNSAEPSRISGRSGQGRIDFAKVMPPSGDGYETYTYLGAALGRQYVHSAVFATLRQAFASTAARQPGRLFQLAETGWRRGGRIRPHRTHQTGTSVDILMPATDAAGRPAQLTTWPWKLFGYGWEFDEAGRSGTLRIDFETLAELLLALDAAGARNGLRIERIIVTPEYIPLIFATPSGPRLEALRGHFMRHAAWVRHDEHVHVDFALDGDR
jgi:penicillin-insensitive murein endopeptidase